MGIIVALIRRKGLSRVYIVIFVIGRHDIAFDMPSTSEIGRVIGTNQ